MTPLLSRSPPPPHYGFSKSSSMCFFIIFQRPFHFLLNLFLSFPYSPSPSNHLFQFSVYSFFLIRFPTLFPSIPFVIVSLQGFKTYLFFLFFPFSNHSSIIDFYIILHSSKFSFICLLLYLVIKGHPVFPSRFPRSPTITIHPLSPSSIPFNFLFHSSILNSVGS